MSHNLQKILTPIAIIIAGIIIAVSVYVVASRDPSAKSASGTASSTLSVYIPPVTSVDHIRGNLNAKIVIVDYSDLECPFCKQFHQTLIQIFNQYGPTNQVAWVYRHFPLDIHTRAPHEAEASECANELGGNTAFWNYIDDVFATTTSEDTLDPAQLPIIAGEVGLDTDKFMDCLNSGRYADKVTEETNDAIKAGGNATPFTVLVVNGQNIPLVDSQGNGLGALSYSTMNTIISKLLQ
jgi:protein-disulfide isomerase